MPVFDDREASVDKAVSLIREAARHGASLVTFPEAWIPGYPFAGWLALPGGRAIKPDVLRRCLARHHHNAVTIPSEATEALGRAAQETGVHVVIGITEREREYSGGTLYNTLLFIGPDGGVIGKHRKLVPTCGERVIWGGGDGSTLEVFDTPLGRLGGLICAEHVMPLARYALHAQGEQVHVASWVVVDDKPTMMTRFHAYEGRSFVIGVGMPIAPHLLRLRGRDGSADLEDDVHGLLSTLLDQVGTSSFGSVVYGPNGECVAGPFLGEEGLLYADIDLAKIAFEKLLLDVAGHGSRPDVFELVVKTAPQVPIRFDSRGLK
jgi:nitrilase